ncbi:hypothetical protein I600_669 [Maribacter dokdonensis DSW-8]|nr:hypothetical protein I600_669 [Maribacter dokdonensis DSW-8]
MKSGSITFEKRRNQIIPIIKLITATPGAILTASITLSNPELDFLNWIIARTTNVARIRNCIT